MTWFKVDDTLALHPKILAAGNAATGLWVRAGAWSMQQLTDGFVPTGIARTLGTPGEAKRLVSVGLWLQEPDGYRFHQWTDVQRTKDQVNADRHAASERQRIARERAKSQRESRRDKSVTSGVSHGGSHGPPDQTRPDQTRTTEAYASPVASAPAKRERFDEWWETYAKKVDRKKAVAAYEAALKKPGVTEQMLIATTAAYITWQLSEGKHPKFTKDPHRWLQGECWRDERKDVQAPPSNFNRHLQLAQQLAEREGGPRPPEPRQIGSGR